MNKILFLMAAPAEYGEHLKELIEPVFIGVGPVESAIRTATLLAAEKPDLIVSLGSAGSRCLEQAEIYQASTVSYRDMDASPLGFEKGRTPFLDLPVEIPLGHHIAGLPLARLSTGANIVSGAAYEAIDADMVDMESFAVVRAAMEQGVPVICLRGISDGARELHHYDDWTEYLHVIDEKLADAVDRLKAAIADGLLAA